MLELHSFVNDISDFFAESDNSLLTLKESFFNDFVMKNVTAIDTTHILVYINTFLPPS